MKRRVDQTNQRRNDLAEELDRALLGWLEAHGLPNPSAPLHSESPGLIIDRLSILALKIYHTREEAERTDRRAPGHADAQPRSPGNPRRTARRPGRLPRCPVAGDPCRDPALQALPPVEDVQRPLAQPRHLPQTPG